MGEDMTSDFKDKLWCDLKTDQERADFIRSGRALETGIIAQAIVEDVATAFEFRAGHLVAPNPPGYGTYFYGIMGI